MKKKISILITGVPGTGKTTVAKILAEKNGAALLDINKVVDVLHLYTHTDGSDGAKVVRLPKLEEELSRAIKSEKKSLVAEGHLGCEMKLPVSKVFVLRCEPKVLRQRLSSRNYNPEKLASNAMSEALDYCTVLSEKNYGAKKVWEIDTTKMAPEEVAVEIAGIISGKKRKKEPVSFPDALMREAITGEKIRRAMV